MATGTIVLTNNSTAVTGTGTAFKTDLASNDFIVAVVGGVTYTLGVKSIESDTALTLTAAYNGPTASGAAWSAVANQTLVGITAQVAADVAKAIRGLNQDKANWQQVYSGTGNVTVKLPDGSTYSGPSWNSITNLIAGKADLTNGAVAVSQGGTGAKNKADAWAVLASYGTTAGTAAQGNDSRLGTVNNKTGGTITSSLTVSGSFSASAGGSFGGNIQLGNYGILTGGNRVKLIEYVGSGFLAISIDGAQYAIDFRNSDREIKENVNYEPGDPLEIAEKIKPVSFTYNDKTFFRGTKIPFGVIAQDVEEIFPDAVRSPEGTYKQMNDNAIIPWLMTCAHALSTRTKKQQSIIDSQSTEINELKARMKAIDRLDS